MRLGDEDVKCESSGVVMRMRRMFWDVRLLLCFAFVSLAFVSLAWLKLGFGRWRLSLELELELDCELELEWEKCVLLLMFLLYGMDG